MEKKCLVVSHGDLNGVNPDAAVQANIGNRLVISRGDLNG